MLQHLVFPELWIHLDLELGTSIITQYLIHAMLSWCVQVQEYAPLHCACCGAFQVPVGPEKVSIKVKLSLSGSNEQPASPPCHMCKPGHAFVANLLHFWDA